MIKLSRQEQAVWEMVNRGHTIREIADDRGTKYATIQTHIKHINKKLGLSNSHRNAWQSALRLKWEAEQKERGGVSELAEHVNRQKEWSSRVFGSGLRTYGITRHIEKECEEIRRDPRDLEEWVDVITLGIDGYWRHGGRSEELLFLLSKKLIKNMGREWGDAADETTPCEHVRS